MLILREAFIGVDRFDVWLGRLSISRAILTDRLAMLVAAGILERVPPEGKRAVYRMTPAGEALRPVYETIAEWGDVHLPIAERKRDASDGHRHPTA